MLQKSLRNLTLGFLSQLMDSSPSAAMPMLYIFTKVVVIAYQQ